MQLLGMSLDVQDDQIYLDSFGYYQTDSMYMKDFEMVSGPKVKKAHALQLLIDEMALEMLRWRQSTNKSPTVSVVLTDAWEPKPGLEIHHPFPFAHTASKRMNSGTRFKYLTGTPSYYTHFGFLPVVPGVVSTTSALTMDAVEAAYARQNDFYWSCVEPRSSPQVRRKNDPIDQPSICSENIGTGTYFKRFQQNEAVHMFGAFAQSQITFRNPDEYFAQVVKQGKYPPLETLGLRMVRVPPAGAGGTAPEAKRRREE